MKDGKSQPKAGDTDCRPKAGVTNKSLVNELLNMIAEDDRVSEELAGTGELFIGYNPKMAEVHRNNAKRLDEIVARHGWPDECTVGKEGSEAAWRIAQHAIDQPDFQRRMFVYIENAAEQGRVEPWQPAYLEDRIRSLEGRPQRYGTQFDWDESGEMSPYPEIEDPANVNTLRASVGLPPIEEAIEKHRKSARLSNERKPANLRQRRIEMDEWARSVGWRS
ncbi:MAG TPA: DUF6624 domain-containing protein [Acidobacteriota bacterium]|nr:DUF6624 domain-containing protein [Acidobacteriota bacterium]